MKYRQIVAAKFIERQNRFVARVAFEQEEALTHVRNTGRCKELLIPGAAVYLEDHIDNIGSRKYRYSLVAVEKEVGVGKTILINMDSQAPNKVVHEALSSGKLKLWPARMTKYVPEVAGDNNRSGVITQPGMSIRPETTYGSSRFDFYMESGVRQAFIEVKGVTLEENGIARFPDAPTERGVKHIRELIRAAGEGYDAYIIFVIQMKGIHRFEPNYATHPQFGRALRYAKAKGVKILAYDCKVTPDSLALDQPVPVKLRQTKAVRR